MIESLTSDYKLGVLIHLSDEFMGSNGATLACSQVYNRATLVLRQYAFHGNHHHNNLVQIPLGYMTGMLVDYNDSNLLTLTNSNLEKYPYIMSLKVAENSLLLNTSSRTNNWSFVGGKHGHGTSIILLVSIYMYYDASIRETR